MDERLTAEIAYRTRLGAELVTVAEMGRRYAALGYTLDRSLDCRSLGRWMSGERAGQSYPVCTTGVREADTGLSAFNVDARRDERFRQMQALRQDLIAVSRGALLEP